MTLVWLYLEIPYAAYPFYVSTPDLLCKQLPRPHRHLGWLQPPVRILIISFHTPFSGAEPVPNLFDNTLSVPNFFAQDWAVLQICCSPLAVSWQATLVGAVPSNTGAQIILKLVLAVYVSLDSHLIVLSLSNKTASFRVYPSCQKSAKNWKLLSCWKIMIGICRFMWYSVFCERKCEKKF